MIRTAVLLALFGACMATSYYKPKTNRCFQCEYRPPKTHTVQVPRHESYDVQVPVHTQECREEQVLAGYKVTQVEKKTNSYFQPSNGYGGGQSQGYGGGQSQGYGGGQSQGYGGGQSQGYGGGQSQGYGGGYHQQPQTYKHQEPVYKTVKRCTPKVEYKTESRYRTVYDTKTQTTGPGGFEPCMGPITAYSGKADGVDDWECYGPCFIRTDRYGTVARGCYKGEFGVDPHAYGPQTVNGQTYVFCKGDHCNGAKVH